jgi:hypothetical protein
MAGDTPWDKGEPSPGLVDFLAAHPELPRGRVCVPGCGYGHDVRAWARAGFEAVGVDVAPSAVRRGLELSREFETGIGFMQADFLLASGPAGAGFDWLFEHTLYCAVPPDARSAYADAARRWLRPEGQFLAVHYLIPNQDGPPFGTTREEVVARFEPWFDLVADWTPRSYPNRTGLERMFWWRRRPGTRGAVTS